MTRLFAFALGAIMALTTTAHAEGRQRLGYGRLITNDLIGDTYDRWRTGSYASSRVWGPEWQGQAPDGFGQLLEFRFNGEIIAPENLAGPSPVDRPYVGALSFGLHTHFQPQQIDYAVGADLVVTGPQTGLDDFQDFLHDVLGGRKISPQVRRQQLGNNVFPRLVVEAGREFEVGRAHIRPFGEARLGVEDLIRAGADVSFGRVGQGELMIREPTTGQRYRVVQNPFKGYAFVVGGDIAYVDRSEYLPASSGIVLTEERARVRAGLHWENAEGTNAFYGLTWLSEEFETQRRGQFVGSVRLRLQF